MNRYRAKLSQAYRLKKKNGTGTTLAICNVSSAIMKTNFVQVNIHNFRDQTRSLEWNLHKAQKKVVLCTKFKQELTLQEK